MVRISVIALILFAPVLTVYGDDHDAHTAQQAGSILRNNCYRCHKGQGSESGYAFNVLDVESMLDEGMIAAGDPENSDVYDSLFSGRMPPRNRPQLPHPTPEEAEVLRLWIASGAHRIPPPNPRPVLSLMQQQAAIRAHLQSVPRDQRIHLRYLTLTHLHNDTSVDGEHLRMTRIALAKVVNSLSWQSEITTPQPIDEAKTIYAVRLDQLGWTRSHWNAVISRYPYSLSFDSLDEASLSDIDADIMDLRGADRTAVAVRADWLVAVATKPPLYYSLLYDLHLPDLEARKSHSGDVANPKSMTDLDLETFLGVRVNANILAGRAQRSGFTESGISDQNRLLERHDMSRGGFYWKSYDFKSSNRSAILTEFPLGPTSPVNEYNDLSFDHDGGEIIFSLPNGLQAYLLVDAHGNRIDAGPIEVVADSLRTSGNEQIVAGVSCIACHRVGMIESPDDEVRKFSGVVGEARQQVRSLYPENRKFRTLLEQDRKQFLRSLTEVTRDFVGDDHIEDLPEPVGEVARRFHLEPMTIRTVAAELYVNEEQLRAALQADPRLRQMGLRVLLRDGGAIKRAAWESPAAFPLMKATARQFGFDPR